VGVNPADGLFESSQEKSNGSRKGFVVPLENEAEGGNRFRRQQPIAPYIVDFVCFEKKLIVELDGGQHAEQSAYDAERTTWLESQGFRVLRFWNNQILMEIEAVKEVIWKELVER